MCLAMDIIELHKEKKAKKNYGLTRHNNSSLIYKRFELP